MRLTLFIQTLHCGGAERMISLVASHWAQRGDARAVTLLTYTPPAEDFYPLHPLVVRRVCDPPQAPVGQAGRFALRIAALRRALAATRPDVIVSFIDASNVEVLCATRGLGVPVIACERSDPRRHAVGRHTAALRRVLYPRAGAVVVQTEALRGWAESIVPRSQIAVIPNFVRTPPAANGAAREPLVVGIGSLKDCKGFDLLIDAFAAVARAHPDWRLAILGEGPRRPELTRRIEELGLRDRASLPGAVRDPDAWLRRAGLFVLSSRYEGFPNVLLEAMANGAPVVAADCPSGPREIIRHGVDGLLVPPEDPEALAGALWRLVEDDAERARLGARAADVADRFSASSVMAAWDGLCRRAAGAGSPPA